MDRETAELLAKYKDGLELYYPEIPNDINGAINAMLWFYECGKENIDKKKSKKSGSGKRFMIITMMQIIFMQLSLNNIILI